MAVSALAGYFSTGTGALNSTIDVTGSITISGTSVVFFFFNGRTETTDTIGRATRVLGAGWAVSSTDRRAQVSQSQDAVAAATGGSYHTDAACIASCGVGTTTDGLLDFDSWLSNGFRLIVDDVMPVSYRVGYLIVTGLTNAQSVSWLDDTTTGNKVVTTGLSFQPDALFAMATNIDTNYPGGRNGNEVLGLGFALSSTARATLAGGQDQGSLTGDTDSYCTDGEFLMALSASLGSSANARYDLVSMNSNGFTIAENLVPTTFCWNHFLAIKGGLWSVQSVTTQTDTTTDINTGSLGFSPKGAIIFSAYKAEHTVGTPTIHDTRSIGVTDGTNRFALAIRDEDGVADMQVTTSIEHDAVYTAITSGSAVEGLMDVKTWADPITFIMDDADPSGKFVTMLVVGESSSITGTLSKTLDNITSTTASTLSVGGTLSKSLDSITSTTASTLSVDGSLSKTLDNTTSTTASSLLIDATLSKTLENITSTTEVNAIATGTASLTFDNNTLTASAVATYEPITGSLTSTLGNVTSTTAGTVSVGGTLSKSLGTITSTTAVGVLITGSTPTGGGGSGTVTKNWNFTSDADGFTDSGTSSNMTVSWHPSLGSPSAGSLQWYRSSYVIDQETARTGTGLTWENFGVPSGATVTSVKVTSWKSIGDAPYNIQDGVVQMQFVNASNTTVHSAGLLVNESSTGTSSWTTYTNGIQRNIDSSYQASTTPVKFSITCTPSGADDGDGTWMSQFIDTISVDINYTTAGGAGGIETASTTLNASGNVIYTGTLSKTLANTTVSASGTVAITGSLSKSLDNVTITGSGTVAVDGTLSKTLDNITSTTASTLSVSGTLSKTLDDITSTTEVDAIATGSGTSLQSSSISLNGVSNAEISGTLSRTLGDVTSSSSATLSITGTSSVEAVSTTISATGVVEAQPSITGDLSKTLDNITVSGSGTVDVSGSLSRTLGDTTLSGSATVDITGSLSKTLDATSLSASASLLIDATLTKTLDAITETGSATNLVTGSLSKESVSTTTSASGTVDITGTLSRTLSDTTSSSASTLSVSGTLSKTLGDVTLEGVGNLGAVPITGSLTSTLDSLSVSGSASAEVSGTLSKTLDNISTTADAVVLISGSLSKTLDSISSSSAGLVDVSGTLTTTLGNITSSGTGFIAGSLFLEQEGFRFRNDDGSEATATWLASQDSNILVTPDMPFRIRILIDSSGGASSSSDYQLEYRKKISTAPDVWNDWKKVE